MKRIVVLFSFMLFGYLSLGICSLHAEALVSVEEKQEIISDRQEIKATKEEMKDNAQAAKSEEEALKEQIQAAETAKDLETAKQLREQLRLIHHENVEEKNEDKKEIKADIQELKNDIKGARQDGNLPPKFDKDNNPPGPKGGAGTNWENPPGPVGGPGASPDRRSNR
jgi:hypothetical protein